MLMQEKGLLGQLPFHKCCPRDQVLASHHTSHLWRQAREVREMLCPSESYVLREPHEKLWMCIVLLRSAAKLVGHVMLVARPIGVLTQVKMAFPLSALAIGTEPISHGVLLCHHLLYSTESRTLLCQPPLVHLWLCGQGCIQHCPIHCMESFK